MEYYRPSPEDILKDIERKEKRAEKGNLKIFFGYAAGVGKTYSMLKAAKKKKEEGINIVCGYIEPHARPETMRLIEGFETLPVKSIEHNGIYLREVDTDMILKRRPQIVLIDEFAHTNATGCRHEKRYQDVEEILNAGIDVYTTVNVQHLESLCDIVASITGIFVRERIPDRIFDLADEVQLVDLEPAELITRLEEGKVYQKTQAKQALNHFFSEEKLTALRELALRRSADRVNLLNEKVKRLSGNEYFTEEKIMVGISSSPSNPKIIRAAARMAQAFGGEFIAVFVERQNWEEMSAENKKRLKDNMHLAKQLGAKVENIAGEDVAFILAEYARISGVSKIVIGRSNVRRGLFSKPSFAERLSILAPNLDIYIIPDSSNKPMKERIKGEYSSKEFGKDTTKSLLILGGATLIGIFFNSLGFSEVNIITVYILGVMISGIVTSHRIYSFILSVLSVILFNYFFTNPVFSLETYETGYPITFLITFLAALLSSTITQRMKKQTKDAAKAAYKTQILLETNQILQNAADIEAVGKTVSIQLGKLLSRDIVFYKAEHKHLGEPTVVCVKPNENKEKYCKESEQAVAAWVFKNHKRAGASTATLGSAKCYYLSIRNHNTAYGVIGIAMEQGENLETFESNILFAILAQAALVMEAR